MNTCFTRLQCMLRKNGYVLAAFIISLAVRGVPEILSWPYPLGLDTLRYIPYIQRGWVFSLGPLGFMKTTGLFYLVAAFPYGLFHDAFIVIKILGPVLLGVLSVMMYLYARRALGWSSPKSLLVSVLVSTYFVSLRISWDLYKQTLGLIFLMATLIALRSFSSPRRYYVACVLMVMTVLSHELAAVIMFFVIGLEAVAFLVKKSIRDFEYLLGSAGLAGALFLFQRYSPQQATVVIPIVSVASEPSVNLALHIGGLLIYCYVLILPLVFLGIVGLRDSFLKYWTVLCVGIPLLTMACPDLPLYYWNRWVYLLVYPLSFYAAHGFGRLWKAWSHFKGNLKRLVPKVFAVAYLFSLLTLSGYYLTTSPENAFPYYSQYNPYLTYIPSSMLQTTVSIKDTSSLIECLQWLNNNTDGSSVIVAHYALYDWIFIYLHDRLIVPVCEDASMWAHIQNEATLAGNMVEAAKEASASDHNAVYTVWWIREEGWYQIPNLPSDFKEVYRAGRMAVYLYSQRV